jgi:hypothetical protein
LSARVRLSHNPTRLSGEPTARRELEDDSTPVLSVWEYVGCGYLDVLLAAGVEASIRVAREALIDKRRGPPP